MIRFTFPVLAAICLCGCDSSTPPTANQQVVVGGAGLTDVAFNADGLPTVVISVPDMHCELMCAPKVRDALAKQPGVKDVKTDIDSHTATVAIDPAAFNSEDAIAALHAVEFPEAKLAEPDLSNDPAASESTEAPAAKEPEQQS